MDSQEVTGIMEPRQLYQPLPEDAIRLVRLLRGNWRDPLKLDLIITNVSHHYVALSYTWGSGKKNHEAIVDGIVKKIGLNLDCALRTLRSPTKSIILWVDDLCINQQDMAEKSSQVNSMHHIYERAQQVHAYIGNSLDHPRCQSVDPDVLEKVEPFEFPSDDNAAWTIIENSFSELEASGPDSLPPVQRCKCIFGILRALSSPTLAENLSKLELFAGKASATRAEHLQELFEWLRYFVVAPWWARVWIIQEVGAARKLQLTYGKITVPFTMLEAAAQELVGSERRLRKIGSANSKVLDRFVSQVQTICSLRQLHRGESYRQIRQLEYFERGWGSPLLWLLRTFRHRHSSEPRDKIFALSHVLSNMNPGYYDLGIDYSAPISDLFCKVALSIIQQTGILWITARDLASKDRYNLPSWIPDWSYGYHINETDVPLALRLCHNASRVTFVGPDGREDDAVDEAQTPIKFFRKIARSGCKDMKRKHIYKKETTHKFQAGAPFRDVGDMKSTYIYLDWPKRKSRFIHCDSYDAEGIALTKVQHSLKVPSQYCSTVEFVSETIDANLSNISSIIESLEEARYKVFPNDWKNKFFDERLDMIGKVLCFGAVCEDGQMLPRRLEAYDSPNLSLLVLLRLQKATTQTPEEFDAEWKRIYRVKFTSEAMGKCDQCSTSNDRPCQDCLDAVDSMGIPSPAEWRKDSALVALKQTAIRAAPGNCILFTRDGNLALGPPGVQAGDRIYILTGGLCPHILRRRPESNYVQIGYLAFSLIGDCYLDKTPEWAPEKLETIALV